MAFIRNVDGFGVTRTGKMCSKQPLEDAFARSSVKAVDVKRTVRQHRYIP